MLIKFDILGNGSLSVLRDALAQLEEQGEPDPNVNTEYLGARGVTSAVLAERIDKCYPFVAMPVATVANPIPGSLWNKELVSEFLLRLFLALSFSD